MDLFFYAGCSVFVEYICNWQLLNLEFFQAILNLKLQNLIAKTDQPAGEAPPPPRRSSRRSPFF